MFWLGFAVGVCVGVGPLVSLVVIAGAKEKKLDRESYPEN